MLGVRTPEQKRKPLYDWTDDEILARLRKMYDAGNYVHAPNDYVRELQRRTEARHATVSIVTSIVTALTAIIAAVVAVVALVVSLQP